MKNKIHRNKITQENFLKYEGVTFYQLSLSCDGKFDDEYYFFSSEEKALNYLMKNFSCEKLRELAYEMGFGSENRKGGDFYRKKDFANYLVTDYDSEDFFYSNDFRENLED